MRNLHIHRSIPDFVGSYVLLSTSDNVNTAIFFVHGFMGDSNDTFWAFQYFCDAAGTPKWWEDVDLYFFSYNSVTDLLSTSTNKWSDFLRWHFPQPPAKLFKIQAYEMPFRTNDVDIRVRELGQGYSNAILVGHSEGAVLIRSDLVNRSRDGYTRKEAVELNTDPVLHSLVRLFAPAHLGACPTGIFGLIFNTPIIKTSATMFLDWSKAATELRKSPILEHLKESTEELASQTHLSAYHADVVFGGDESVVSVGGFMSDNMHVNVLGHTHTSICKPTHAFDFPLTFVSQERRIAHGS